MRTNPVLSPPISYSVTFQVLEILQVSSIFPGRADKIPWKAFCLPASSQHMGKRAQKCAVRGDAVQETITPSHTHPASLGKKEGADGSECVSVYVCVCLSSAEAGRQENPSKGGAELDCSEIGQKTLGPQTHDIWPC